MQRREVRTARGPWWTYSIVLALGLVIAYGTGCETGSSSRTAESSPGSSRRGASSELEGTEAIRIEIDRESIRFRGESLVRLEPWRLPNSARSGMMIPLLRERLATTFQAEGTQSASSARTEVRLHPLVPYDVWSRVAFTVSSLQGSDLYAGLIPEEFDEFAASELRRFGTPGSESAGRDVRLKGLLGREKERQSEGGTPGTDQAEPAGGEVTSLVVRVRADGFAVRTPEGPVEPVEGCPSEGPTICTGREPSEIRRLTREARRALDTGDTAVARDRAEQVQEAYGFRRLYGVVATLDREKPEIDRLRMEAESAVPSFLVTEASDHLALVLPSRSYGSESAYQIARAQADERDRALFPTVVLGAPFESSDPGGD